MATPLADAFGNAANLGPAPLARGGSSAAQAFNAAHPRVAKGRSGGGRFAQKGSAPPSSSDGVKHIERNLKVLGFEASAAGLAKFQSSRGLPATGRFDGETERALRNAVYVAAATAKDAAAAKATVPLRTATVDANKVIQGNLQKAGFNVSPTGTWTDKDAQALAAFQQAHGVKVEPARVGADGAVSVSPETQSALGRYGWAPASGSRSGSTSSSSGSASSSSAASGGSSAGSVGASAAGSSGSSSAAASRAAGGAYAQAGDGMRTPDARVRTVQEKLDALGYELGASGVDGRFGAATRAAVSRFQSDHGIDATGVVDIDTLYALMKMVAERSAKARKGSMNLSADEPSVGYSHGTHPASTWSSAATAGAAARAGAGVVESSLAEAFEGAVLAHVLGVAESVAHPWEELLHPRGRGGKFRAKPGGGERFAKAMDVADARVDRNVERGAKRDARKAEVAARSAASPANPESSSAKAAAAEPKSALVAAGTHFNDSGHVSQRTLLRYVADATQGERTIERYAQRADDGSLVWDESRRALHESIIDAFLRRRKMGENGWELDPNGAPIEPSADPSVLFSGGGYAAGKSSVLRKLPPERMPDGVDGGLVLDPDQIKAQLPEFQQGLVDGDPEANLRTYEEAWAIAQEIQARAQERRINLIVDGISNTSSEEMMARLKSFTDKGYKAHVVYVDIPTEDAVSRAQGRAKSAKSLGDRRYIPEAILRSVHRDVAATIPRVLESIAGASGLPVSAEVWDNAQPDRVPKRMAWVDAGKPIEVIDEPLWKRLHVKAQEHIPSVDVLDGGVLR